MCAKRSQVKSESCAKKDETSASKWKQAIYHVEQEISAERMKIERLEKALVSFRQLESQGVPWPGHQSATQN